MDSTHESTQLRASWVDKRALAQLDALAARGELGWGAHAIRAFGKLVARSVELVPKTERPTSR